MRMTRNPSFLMLTWKVGFKSQIFGPGGDSHRKFRPRIRVRRIRSSIAIHYKARFSSSLFSKLGGHRRHSHTSTRFLLGNGMEYPPSKSGNGGRYWRYLNYFTVTMEAGRRNFVPSNISYIACTTQASQPLPFETINRVL